MPEETQEPKVQEPKVQEPLTDVFEKKEITPPAEAKNTDHMIPKTRLDEEIQKRKEIERQAKDAAKRLEELEKAEASRKAAEMTEAEKATARIKELETANAGYESRLKAQEHERLQTTVARAVAKELSLPFDAVEALADRLRGETEEELTADAKIVFAILPKQDAKPDSKLTPKIEPTNPGNGVKGETDAQKRARLMGRQVNIWDPELARQHGGGVTFVEKGE